MKPGRVGAAVAVLALAAAPTPTPELGEILERLQARYDATADLTARVTQEIEMASLGKTLTAHGSVRFKRPGRMRWEFADSDPQTIVADGETLWLYQPEENQVLKASFQSAFRSSTPVSFLTGLGKIARDFEVAVERVAADLVYLRLRPRDAADIGSLLLGVDRTTFDIRLAEVRDPLGNTTRLRFDDIRRNTGIDDRVFRFEVPRGADVIEVPRLE